MPAISVKLAVMAAKKAINELYHDDPPKGLALEEIELTTKDGKEIWEVTLGFYRARNVSLNALASIYQPRSEVENRVYKICDIDAETGDFLRMSMRSAP